MVPVDTEKAKYNAVYVTGRVGGVDRDIEEYIHFFLEGFWSDAIGQFNGKYDV